MASNRSLTVLVALPVAVGNLLHVGSGARATPPTGFTDPQFYAIIRHVRVVNTTAGALTCTFYVGGSGGSGVGTQVFGSSLSVAANSYIDVYCQLRLDSGQYLTGLTSGAANSLVATIEGELGAAG